MNLYGSTVGDSQLISDKKPVMVKKTTGKTTILVVDDSPTIRKVVSLILSRRGFEVLVAENGLEALAQMNTTMPSLIFLDITMPRMDGYQLCKIIRNKAQTKTIPIVMLTAKDGFFDKVKGRMAGASGYITKPFNAPQLLDAVDKYLIKPEKVQ
jgi:twitching motility two-component system response regulator PilG